jgi:serine O-acetyltransferase
LLGKGTGCGETTVASPGGTILSGACRDPDARPQVSFADRPRGRKSEMVMREVGSTAKTGAIRPRRSTERALARQRYARNPPFFYALVEDAKVTARWRNERSEYRSPGDTAAQTLRLACMSNVFLAQALYRAQSRLRTLRIPILPDLAHRLAIGIGQVSIGDSVIVEAGLFLTHGHVIIEGLTELGSGTVISPFVTIGLGSVVGPTVGRGVRIEAGARLTGPVHIGARARIGANAVVTDDVPQEASVMGIPAKIVDS